MTKTKAYRGHLLVEDLDAGLAVLSPEGEATPVLAHPIPKKGVHVGDPHWEGYSVGGTVGATPERAMRAFVDAGAGGRAA